ncbi:TetR/AcrR family transcriptional regulator [Leptolyngbya sp. AN02str]|uniref:TetR/AcrR family transcriptional regulator n=1 Tax=Leptolyngbya sp. AN02str TaxID=3423363 RepID=UPI003D3134E7
MPKESYLPCLMQLFRQHGYDGATLSKISEATGLGKASLYHHFPGGKDEMVEAVLDFAAVWMQHNIIQPLGEPGEPITKLQNMCDRVHDLYAGGERPCLLAILLLGSARDTFHSKVQGLIASWIEAIATVLQAAGMEPAIARLRGEDAIIAIQGSLILAQGLGNVAPFQRVLRDLPQTLCDELALLSDVEPS